MITTTDVCAWCGQSDHDSADFSACPWEGDSETTTIHIDLGPTRVKANGHADYPHAEDGDLPGCPACEAIEDEDGEPFGTCPWCGDPIDYCPGHGDLNGVDPDDTVVLGWASLGARIAAYYQTPGGQGAVFASVASAYPRTLADILSAIDSERREWARASVTGDARADVFADLDMLRSLAIEAAATWLAQD